MIKSLTTIILTKYLFYETETASFLLLLAGSKPATAYFRHGCRPSFGLIRRAKTRIVQADTVKTMEKLRKLRSTSMESQTIVAEFSDFLPF
jgi:hypothetical protein